MMSNVLKANDISIAANSDMTKVWGNSVHDSANFCARLGFAQIASAETEADCIIEALKFVYHNYSCDDDAANDLISSLISELTSEDAEAWHDGVLTDATRIVVAMLEYFCSSQVLACDERGFTLIQA